MESIRIEFEESANLNRYPFYFKQISSEILERYQFLQSLIFISRFGLLGDQSIDCIEYFLGRELSYFICIFISMSQNG